LIVQQIRIRIQRILHMTSASDGCWCWLAPSHLIIRRHHSQAISLIDIDVSVLSVCLSVCHIHALCSNGRRYRHDFFFLFYTTAPCLSQIVLKLGLLSEALSPKILPHSELPPVNLSVGDFRLSQLCI